MYDNNIGLWGFGLISIPRLSSQGAVKSEKNESSLISANLSSELALIIL